MNTRSKILRLAMAGVAATGLMLAGAPGVAHADTPAVTAKKCFKKNVWGKCVRWMETRDARIVGTTVSALTVLEAGGLRGFRGCVRVRYHDAAGVMLGQSPEHCWGVDADTTGDDHREEFWADAVDPGTAARTAKVTISHYQV